MRGQSVRVGLYTDVSHLHLQAVIAPDHELNDALPTDDATFLTATQYVLSHVLPEFRCTAGP